MSLLKKIMTCYVYSLKAQYRRNYKCWNAVKNILCAFEKLNL